MRPVELLLVLLAAPSAGAAEPQEGGGTLGSEAASASFVNHGLQSKHREDGIRFSGDLYVDTGYERSERALDSEPDIVFWLQQGRFMLQVTPTHNFGPFFFQANAQVLAHVDEIDGDQHIDTDDAWGELGVWDCWDVQVGRYEAWEVYHKGQGLERDTLEDLGAADGPDIYEVNHVFYRQNGFGQAALHVYPTDWARFELGTVFGNDVGFNAVGVRPVGILDLGTLKVKLAGEWRQLANQQEDKKQEEEARGFGGSVQLFLDGPGSAFPLQLGVNGAYSLVDKIDPFGKVDERGSTDTLSVGGFANLGLWAWSLGLGVNYTDQGDRQRNDETDDVGHFDHLQAFVSLKRALPVPAATLKLVLAWARADLRPSFDNARVNEMASARLRLMYVF